MDRDESATNDGDDGAAAVGTGGRTTAATAVVADWFRSILPQQGSLLPNLVEVVVRCIVFFLAIMLAAFSVFIADDGTSANLLSATFMYYNLLGMALSALIRSKRLFGFTACVFAYDWLIHWIFLERNYRTQGLDTAYKVLLVAGTILLAGLFFGRPIFERLRRPSESEEQEVEETAPMNSYHEIDQGNQCRS